MKKITAILLLIIVGQTSAQDAQFSQYYAASIYLNPGFNGIYGDPSIHLNHKRQIQSVDIINELTQVSLLLPLKPKGSVGQPIGGVGVMAFNEKSGFRGVYDRNAVFLNYAQNLKFGVLDSYLISVGVQAGYEMRKLNFSKLTWGSQYNSFYGFDSTLPIPVNEFDARQQNMVINAGIMYFYNPERNYLKHQYSAFFGIAATNLNRPNTSFTINSKNPAPMLLKYHGGIEFKFDKLFFTPSLLYLYIKQIQQFNAGLNFAYVPNADRYRAKGTQLLCGVWYRLRDSFIFMGGIKHNALTIRVSYDMNSNLFVPDKGVDLAQNSMEISLQYTLSKNIGSRRATNPLF